MYSQFRRGTIIRSIIAIQFHVLLPIALCSWNVVKPRRVSTAQPEERDFVRLNKMAVQAGLTSAPEQYQFRATHDVKVSSGSKERSLNKLKKIPPSMVFGISTR